MNQFCLEKPELKNEKDSYSKKDILAIKKDQLPIRIANFDQF